MASKIIPIIKIGDRIYTNLVPEILVPVKFDDNQQPVAYTTYSILPLHDLEQLKRIYRETLDYLTTEYIKNQLSNIDEDLSDITTELNYIEGRILYLFAKEGKQITIDQIKLKVVLYIAGQYTADQAEQELKDMGLSDTTIQAILDLLKRAVEISKIIMWKETVWNLEQQYEDGKINAAESVDQLLDLDLQQLVDSYPKLDSAL